MPATTEIDHYTAIIEIQKVETHKNPNVSRGGGPEETRTSSELTRMVIRAKSLTSLKEKISGHVDLLDEE